MAKKCKNIIIKQGLDDWVMTYGDMMSLLLTFFVLIVSFSSMQETKFEQAAASLADAFGVLATPESVIEFNDPLVPSHNPSDEEAEVLYEVRSVEKLILDEGLAGDVEVEVTKDGVLFRLNAPFMFESAGAGLKNEPQALLDKLSGFFKKFPYKIRVEGHTDDIPIKSGRYGSNWELSASRAVSVARYFQSMDIPPQRISATGYGEYQPIADNGTPEGRSKNRRVEIFLKLDKKDITTGEKLPFQSQGITATSVAPKKKQVANSLPAETIVNPVTGSLGIIPTGKIK